MTTLDPIQRIRFLKVKLKYLHDKQDYLIDNLLEILSDVPIMITKSKIELIAVTQDGIEVYTDSYKVTISDEGKVSIKKITDSDTTKELTLGSVNITPTNNNTQTA